MCQQLHALKLEVQKMHATNETILDSQRSSHLLMEEQKLALRSKTACL